MTLRYINLWLWWGGPLPHSPRLAGCGAQVPRCWDPNLGPPQLFSRGCAPGVRERVVKQNTTSVYKSNRQSWYTDLLYLSYTLCLKNILLFLNNSGTCHRHLFTIQTCILLICTVVWLFYPLSNFYLMLFSCFLVVRRPWPNFVKCIIQVLWYWYRKKHPISIFWYTASLGNLTPEAIYQKII